jgi:hypothetical protein
MLLNEYEIEFMFRKIRNIRNLGNVHIRGPSRCYEQTDAQNGLDFYFNISILIGFPNIIASTISIPCGNATNNRRKIKANL